MQIGQAVLVPPNVSGHDDTRRSYDAVAVGYDRAIGDELAGKPLDRALLAAFLEHCAGGAIGDLGCGPGHIGAHLAGLGARIVGIDLSEQMCALAGQRGLAAAVGDLVALPVADGCLAGVVCWYALIHLEQAERAVGYQEIARVVRPGGWALVAFHTSDPDAQPGDERRFTNWLEQQVELTFRFLDPEAEITAAEAAGLGLSARLDRQPVAGEHPSHRTYLVLQRPPA
jgi:SAM-dependent methyltransferase